MRRYIIYQAEKGNSQGWRERKLAPTGSLTKILAEHYDSRPDSKLPEVGDRLTELVRVEGFADPRFPSSSTHRREGDWIVDKVEEFSADLPGSSFSSIVLCTCSYQPEPSPLEPLAPIQVSEAHQGQAEAEAEAAEFAEV